MHGMGKVPSLNSEGRNPEAADIHFLYLQG